MRLFSPAPGHPLHPYLHSIWRMDGTAGGRRETVLPHGNLDLLFNLGAPFAAVGLTGATAMIQEAPYVAGLQTRALDTISSGRAVLLGVSLRIERTSALLRAPASDLTDLTVDAAPVFPDAAALYGRLRDTPSFRTQCRLLLDWLARRVDPGRRTRLVADACTILGVDDAEAGVSGAARDLGVSSRHLRRVFLDAVGVGPAEYIRLVRFSRGVDLVRRGGSLTAVAQDASYYDHAHFTRDFKAIAGMTPSAYRTRCHTGPTPDVLVGECPPDTRHPDGRPLRSS